MLGIELYTWQKLVALDIMEAIKDPSRPREFVILTSRQIGKTTFAAIMALWIAVFNKLPSDVGNNSDAGIISATDRQAKLVLKEIKSFIRLGDIYCREHYTIAKDDLMDKGIFSQLIDSSDDNNMEVITFKAQKILVDRQTGVEKPEYGPHLLAGSKIGTKLKSYPPTGGVLGQRFAYLHEDECGFAEKFDDEVHNEYLKPTGVARNAIRIYTSTPWVTSGFFYELCDVDDSKLEHPYHRYMFTVDAIKLENPDQYKRVMFDVENMRLDGKKDEVDRAYYCRFVKGEQSFFNPDYVDSMFDQNLGMVERFDGPCDIGIDFGGQVKSRTTITVSTYDKDSNTITRLYHRAYEVGQDGELLADLAEIMKAFPGWQRLIPDDCPAGDFRIRQMIEKGWNVQPMNFRTWKIKKYTAFRAKLNKGLIKSYRDDDLKTEMKALEFNNAAVQSNIMAPRGYRDDLIDGFVMSAFFYLLEERSYGFYSWNEKFGD
jgi:hypothetical protein